MTKEEKEKAIDALKISAPVMAMTQEEFNDYIQILNKVMDWLEQEPKTVHWQVVSDGYGDNAYICECSECKDTVWVYKNADRKWNYCPNCGAKMVEP